MTSNVSATYPYVVLITFTHKMVCYFISVLSIKFLCCSDSKVTRNKMRNATQATQNRPWE